MYKRQDYIRTARAKGLRERTVVYKHALKNALIPVVTLAGMQFSQVFAGAVLVETVFNWPGMGRLAYESILRKDYPTPVSFTHLCVADTQGGIGYQIQHTLKNEFLRRGLCEDSIAVLTQVVVDKDDPGFRNPTKPVGEFYPPERAEVLRRENPSWVLREDAGRGFRRYVPSPRPLEIVEAVSYTHLALVVRCGDD